MSVRIEVSITRSFVAEHSLPDGGMAEPHEHRYEVTCGYAANVDPGVGRGRPVQALGAEVDAVVGQLDGQMLNRVLPVVPTAEMLACWILAQLAGEWEWAEVHAYGGYRCRVGRADVEPLFDALRSGPDRGAQRGV